MRYCEYVVHIEYMRSELTRVKQKGVKYRYIRQEQERSETMAGQCGCGCGAKPAAKPEKKQEKPVKKSDK